MRYSMGRREFIKAAGAVGAGVTLGNLAGRSARAAGAVKTSTPTAEKLGWKLACQLYTFRHVTFYEAVEQIASLGVRLVEPCFFLRLAKDRPKLTTGESLSPAQRKELRKKLADRGMKMPNFYANLGADQDAARRSFDFAREMGVKTFVAEPPATKKAFDAIEKLCDEYKINLAVHNHPKGPGSKFWHPDNVLKVCKGRGKRIGACCDTGHWVRSGLDPVECLRKMKGRIITMHLKDVAKSGDPKARDVPLGTGKAKYAAVLRELHAQGFKGVLAIEYEHQSPKLLDEVAACLKFVEKTAKSL